MSSPEQALASLLSQLALSFDGAVLGIALAYAAVRSLLKFSATSSSLNKILKAPSVAHVSELCSILAVHDDRDSSSSQPSDHHHHHHHHQKLVVLRGTVEAKSAVDSSWKAFKPNVLLSQESGDKAVVVQRTKTTICKKNRKEKLELAEHMLSGKADPNLPILTKKTLLIWGEMDNIFPVFLAHQLQRHLGPKSRLAILKDSGLAVNIDSPNMVNELIKSFVLG